MAPNGSDIEQSRQIAAQRFNKNLDPLEPHQSQFKQMDAAGEFDPFELVRLKVYDQSDISDRTRASYESAIRQWQAFMTSQSRHPACPSDSHVRQFVDHLQTKANRPNSPKTVRDKLVVLNRIFNYWQDEPALPHDDEFNPFGLVLSEGGFDDPETKPFHRVELEGLRAFVQSVKHIRDRAIIMANLKLGLRATEVCNIRLSQISLQNTDLRRHYRELGTDPQVAEYTNAVVIPYDVEGNKSRRTRVLPLDDEMRRIFTQWLLIRPDSGDQHAFLSDTGHVQMQRGGINYAWQSWLPQNLTEETANHKPLTSHFGRHWFTTFWEHQGLEREYLKYLRGDTTANDNVDDQDAVNDYIHTYYEDIEERYREEIFKLGIQ